tara:strand:+ start:347 stop:859 length:513 start_codon:yes stop_codon:yes gene_type:complete
MRKVFSEGFIMRIANKHIRLTYEDKAKKFQGNLTPVRDGVIKTHHRLYGETTYYIHVMHPKRDKGLDNIRSRQPKSDKVLSKSILITDKIPFHQEGKTLAVDMDVCMQSNPKSDYSVCDADKGLVKFVDGILTKDNQALLDLVDRFMRATSNSPKSNSALSGVRYCYPIG